MEIRTIDLGPINGKIEVQICRKNIKNVHLKVFRSLDVKLSVPENVPDDWISLLLSERANWIDAQITKYKLSSGANNISSIRNGSSTQFLGKDMRIYTELAPSNEVSVDEKKIIICVKSKDDELIQTVFRKWWRKTATDIFNREVDIMFAKVFRKYNLEKPTVSIRKMETLWGSCNSAKGRISLNEYLLKADIRCIQYVILHELTHLLYPNHSAEFYNFLTVQMPDWVERKKQLDTEVVQGL